MKDDVMKDDELLVLMNTVRAIPSVQMVVELTNEKIKNKQHLIF
jgi:hypothetical protein